MRWEHGGKTEGIAVRQRGIQRVRGVPGAVRDPELISRGVELRRVRFGDGTISGSVSPADYWETALTARRCGLRIRAGKRRGLYFTALRYSAGRGCTWGSWRS